MTLLNASSGAVAAVYEYSPYGEPIRATYSDASISDQPFRFSTKYTDLETGLVYYGTRYYDPRNGRFINRDTIEEAGGINLYGFVSNNPINKWDLLGMTEGDTRTFYTVDDEGMWEIVETEVYDGAVGGTVWEETSRTLIQKPKPSNNGTDPNKKEPNNMPADPTYGAGATGGMVCGGTAIPLSPFITTTNPGGPNALGTGGIILLGGAAVYIIVTGIDNATGFTTWVTDKIVGPVFPPKVDKKPSESKPTNCPPGTVPLPQAKDIPKGLHGQIKKGADAGPKDWTGITPDGEVITTGPDGKAINWGPWENYVGGNGKGGGWDG